MKTKMSKLLALLASAVLLVCLLAVGVTPASAEMASSYAETILAGDTENVEFGGTTDPEVVWKNNLRPGELDGGFYRPMKGADRAAGNVVFTAKGAITDFRFDMMIHNDSAMPTVMVSPDFSAWEIVTVSRADCNPGADKSGWGCENDYIYGTLDAAKGYKYIGLVFSDTGILECPCVYALEYNYVAAEETVGTAGDAKDSYAKNKDFSSATVSPDGVTLGNNMGSPGTDLNNGYLTWNDGSGKVPVASATLNLGEVFTDFCLQAIIGSYGAQPIEKIEVSVDGVEWFVVNSQKNVAAADDHNPGWHTCFATFTGTVPAEAGYQWIRVTGGGCEYPMSAPALGKFLYNVAEVADDGGDDNTGDDNTGDDNTGDDNTETWTPDLSDNATFVDGQIPEGSSSMADAPISYGFWTGGNMNQNGGTYDNGQHSEWLGAGKMIVIYNTADSARFAFEVNAAKDFNFLVSILGTIADPSTVIKVYAADGFEGGSYAGEAGGHAVEPATPINPKEMKVTFEKDATQGAAGLARWNVKCAEDIPATATYLYLVMDKAATDAAGHWYAIGLLDFDYTSDPVVIVPLPDFGVAEDQELFEDLSSSRLLMADDGQALSITNMMRAAANKFGAFNDADDMLVLNDKTKGGEIVYDLSAYHNYMNETEGYNALVTGLDVRGWIGADCEVTIGILGSADGKTWTPVVNDDGENIELRTSLVYNGYVQFSVLVEDIAAEYSMIKITLDATEGDVAFSDFQIFYTENENAGNDDNGNDDNNNDDNTNDDNDDNTNPDTGVVTPIAALVLATISGAAVVINKRR